MQLRILACVGARLVLGVCLFVLCSPLSAATWYVRTSGRDANSGTTPAQAFRSITKAAQVARAGDTVWIGGGTYDDAIVPAFAGTTTAPIQFIGDMWGTNTGDEGVVMVAGSHASLAVAKDYIWFRGVAFGGGTAGYPGDNPDPDDTTEGVEIVRFSACRGGKLSDCDVWNADDGVRVSNAEATIDSCDLYNNEKNGILVEGTSTLTVRNTTIQKCGNRGVYVRSANAVVIEDSKIFGCGSHGIRSEASSSTNTLTVLRCEIYENTDGIHLHGRSKVTLENCLIRNNREEGLHAHSDSPTITMQHCTLSRNRYDGYRHERGTSTVGNSIFAFNKSDGCDKDGGTLTVTRSCAFGNADKDWEGFTPGTGSIRLDPMFVSTTDYHLQVSSPCVDKGSSSVSTDLEWNARPWGTAVDMGCYEAGGSRGLGREYFVRVTGSDRKNGLTPATAFRSLTKAVSVAVPGDTVWVGGGTFYEAVDISGKAGSASLPIRFTADTDGAKTGDAGDVVVDGGFFIENSSHARLTGFTIQAGRRKPSRILFYAGVHLLAASNISLDGLKVGGGDYGVLASNSAGAQINGCTARNAATHGFAIEGASSVAITGCAAVANAGAGYYASQGTVQLSGCSSSDNGRRGFQINAARGSLLNCSSTNDYLAAELVGIANDRASFTANNLSIQGSRQGAAYLRDCTADVVGGSVPLCSAGPYAAYADNAQLTLRNASITSTQYAVQVVNGGHAQLDNMTISNCAYDGVSLTASSAVVSNCTISSCRMGIRGETKSTLAATNCSVNGSTSWGIYLAGSGLLSGCVFTSNYQGAYLTGATSRGDIVLSNTTIQGTAREGLVATRCIGTVKGGTGSFSQGGSYGAYLLDCDLSLTDFQIQGPEYGITSYSSSLTASGATILNCQTDGIYSDNGKTSLSHSTVRNCRYGIRTSNGGELAMTSCTLEGNTAYAISHTGHGSVTNCIANNNTRGIYLAGSTARGDVTIDGTLVQGTTLEALTLLRCTGTVSAGTGWLSQSGSYSASLSDCDIAMTAPRISGTQYGVISYGSTLRILDAVVADCPSGGVYADGSSLSLANSRFTRCGYGVYGSGNGTLNATGCTFELNTEWAVSHTGYGLLSNCVVNNNRRGVSLTGAAQRGDVKLENTTIQGTALDGLWAVRCTGSLAGGSDKLSKGGDYGVYLYDSELALSNIDIAGPRYGVQSSASTLNLTTASITACTTWGIYHAGYGTLANCAVTNCTRGVFLSGATQASDIQLVDARIQGATAEGVVATRCTGNVLAGTDLLSRGGGYGAYLANSHFTFTDVKIAGPEYGIVAIQSTVNLPNAITSDTTSSGIYATSSTINVTNGVLSRCGSRGIDAQTDSTVNLTATRIERCGDWGLVVAGYANLSSCQITNNRYGAYLVGKAARGDIRLSDLTIGECADQGLVAVRCEGAVRSGAGSLSRGGTYGVYADDSRLTLSGAIISGASYGICSLSSDMTVRDVRISGAATGIYCSANPNLLIDISRVENCSSWGMQTDRDYSQVTNSVFANNANGISVNGNGQVRIWNTTLAGNALYGLYQASGAIDIRNTIIAGTNAGVGIDRRGGQMTMSHNLIHGFATDFSGVTLDANTVVNNPRFTNAAGGDYTLTAGSPAINAGEDLPGRVDRDFVGNARPTFRRWEIGAYEYGQQGGSLRVLSWAEAR